MTNSQRPRGHISSAPIAPAIRNIIVRFGENRTMEHFGLSRIAVCRAAAGLCVQAGTLRLLQDGLDRADELEAVKS